MHKNNPVQNQSHAPPTSQWRPNPRTPKCIENSKDKSAQLFEVRAAWANHALCKSLKADLNEKYCVYIYIYIYIHTDNSPVALYTQADLRNTICLIWNICRGLSSFAGNVGALPGHIYTYTHVHSLFARRIIYMFHAIRALPVRLHLHPNDTLNRNKCVHSAAGG